MVKSAASAREITDSFLQGALPHGAWTITSGRLLFFVSPYGAL